MKRPSEKMLKDMSSAELAAESEWHLREASNLFDRVTEMRARALEVLEQESDEILHAATALEAEAEAHTHQANLLTTLKAARLSDEGVGGVKRAAGV